MAAPRYQFQLIQAIRNFFLKEGFIDVLTPPLVENPGMETHIHPYQIYSPSKKELMASYLHTSPEFHMKKLLAENKNLQDIFTINYCFRDEPKSPLHRNQFLMLEWYRRGQYYEKIMQDVVELISFCQNTLDSKNKIQSFPQVSVAELFKEFLKIDILNFLNTDDLKSLIKKDFPEVPLPESDCQWDDYYFLLFLNKIEPKLKNYPFLLIKEFPAPLAALSTIKKDDPRVCERFEIYLSGIELCNCFNELTDLKEQKMRFLKQKSEKKELYNYDLPWPEDFIQTLEKGLPPCAGIALGVERLLLCLSELDNPFYT